MLTSWKHIRFIVNNDLTNEIELSLIQYPILQTISSIKYMSKYKYYKISKTTYVPGT